jgi:outer membrane protein OmpA-like peptidoglycan-associated protein
VTIFHQEAMIDLDQEDTIMNRQFIYLPCAVLAAALAGCTAPPHKDIPLLTSEIDAVVAGHYGQSIYHEEMAEESLEDAAEVLDHWKNDEYWNIDEGEKAVNAARTAAKHRFESEKALCRWLTAVHGPSHHQAEVPHQSAAFFKTGSAVPFKINQDEIAVLGQFLQTHPEASADVTAYTDTVGTAQSNQNLAERRANAVSQLLIQQGAKPEQLRVRAVGEAEGPDNAPNQHHRVVMMSTVHLAYQDCIGLK